MSSGRWATTRRRIPSTSGDHRFPTTSSSITRARCAAPPAEQQQGSRIMTIVRRAFVVVIACAIGLAAGAAAAQPAGPPIRIGSTLALTGPLASTGICLLYTSDAADE